MKEQRGERNMINRGAEDNVQGMQKVVKTSVVFGTMVWTAFLNVDKLVECRDRFPAATSLVGKRGCKAITPIGSWKP